MSGELVPLCQCWDLAEAQVIRASLEARGIPVLIEGEHHRGMMGMFAAAVKLRVMVPDSHLEVARDIASDLIPDLARAPIDDGPDRGERFSPTRRPHAEDLVDYVNDDDDDGTDDGDDGELELFVRKKSMAVAVLLSLIGLAVGTLHIYAGKEKTGGVLFVIAAAGFGLAISGNPIGSSMVVGVWIVDIIRGFVLLRRHNRALEASPV